MSKKAKVELSTHKDKDQFAQLAAQTIKQLGFMRREAAA